LARVNEAAELLFDDPAPMNHVLAQIYHNDRTRGKASIKRHSDKTKDMPKNGVMAFCTFYDGKWAREIQPSSVDPFDLVYKGTSALTRLKFKLKDSCPDEGLAKEFDVLLYPNSVFLMPLRTNRLYTHEIRPSALPIRMLATRMGYVVRCSDREASFQDGQTILRSRESGQVSRWNDLQTPTPEDVERLRNLYYRENTTCEEIVYPEDLTFSLNDGDRMEPIL
jgi:hypothetical protein